MVRTSRPRRVRTRNTGLRPSSTYADGAATASRPSSPRARTRTSSPRAPARWSSAAVRTAPVRGSTIGVSQATHLPMAGRAPTTTSELFWRPGQEVVEVEVAGGHAGDGVALLVELLEAVEVVGQEVGEALRAVGDAALVDLVDHRLGPVEGLGDVLGHGVAELGDLAGHADEAAQQRVLLDDAGVAAGVGGGRGGRHDLRQHGRAAERLEQVGPAQLVGHGDRVDRLAGRVERVDGVVDVAVGRLVEVGRGDDAGRRGDGLGRQHHGAEERLLRLEVVRGDTPCSPPVGARPGRRVRAAIARAHLPPKRPVGHERRNPVDLCRRWCGDRVDGLGTSPAMPDRAG